MSVTDIVGLTIVGVASTVAGVFVRVIVRPPTTYRDIAKNAVVAALILIFLGIPASKIGAQKLGVEQIYIFSAISTMLGFLGTSIGCIVFDYVGRVAKPKWTSMQIPGHKDDET